MPEYVRLAYQGGEEGGEAVSIAELPGEFYAVQLLAMSSREALESYVAQRQLDHVSAARVERDGRLYYTLLLGVYETEELARRAAAERPAALAGTTPWIRSVSSLQSAMTRGDALARSAASL
ncbi:MAG: SPOR domain-containing protein [Pseudomonadota bacterium]